MDEKRTVLFYEEMRKTFVKPDSSWTDKGAIFRTILEQFFILMTPELEKTANLFDRITAYYDAHPEQYEMCGRAHEIRKATNDMVHKRVDLTSGKVRRVIKDKDSIRAIYESVVLIIYNATGVMPDDATFALLGVNPSAYLDGLNEQQKDAVMCEARIVFVNAGPGTGKTFLLERELIHHVMKDPEHARLVALSFTNTAAAQLGERFEKEAFGYLHGMEYEFFNGTIHSYCLRKLREFHSLRKIPFNYMIVGDDDLFEMAPEISDQTGGALTIEQVKELLNSGKALWPANLVDAITQLKHKYQLISINDILTLFLEHLTSDEPFARWLMDSVDIVVIDEAQDLNESNFRILDRMLELKPSLKLFLVGDPRQNIFEFNGGSYQNLEGFMKRHKGEIGTRDLSVSYRCPDPILGFANSFQFTDCSNIALSSGIPGSLDVKRFPDEASEAKHIVSRIKEYEDLNSCAVLSHTIKGMSTLIDQLNAERIPYTVFGGKRRLKAYIRLVNNLLRIIHSNNEKSIRSVAKALNIDIKSQPLGTPRHLSPKELFYQTPFGRRLRALAKDYAVQGWSLPELAGKLMDGFVPKEMSSSPECEKDFRTLRNQLRGYGCIKDYLDAFTVYKDRFITYFEKEFRESETPVEDSWVTLSTIHSAKGLEWEHVFVIGMYEKNFPGIEKYQNKRDSEQEKYLNSKKKEMYVAATRASGSLEFTFPESAGGEKQAPSRLLPELSDTIF